MEETTATGNLCEVWLYSLELVKQHRDGNFPPKHENEKMASFVEANRTELIKQAKQKEKKKNKSKTKQVYN